MGPSQSSPPKPDERQNSTSEQESGGSNSASRRAAKRVVRQNNDQATKEVRDRAQSSNAGGTPSPSATPERSPTPRAKPAGSRPTSPTNSDISDYNQALQSVRRAGSRRASAVKTVGPTISQSDAANSFRSTLALGQLITANTPSAGNRMISQELRSLTQAVKYEGASIRKEIANLPDAFAGALKTVLAEERELERDRRPIFGRLANRRFPIYRRPGRMLLQFARKSLASGLTSPSSSSASSATAPAARPLASNAATQTQAQQPSFNDPALGNRAAKIASKQPSQQQQQQQQQQSQQTTLNGPPQSNQTQDNQQRQQQQQQTQVSKSTAPPPPPPLPTQPLGYPALKDAWYAPMGSSAYDAEADTDTDDSPNDTP